MPRQATYEYVNCGIEVVDAEVTLQTGEKSQGKIIIIHDPAEPARHIIPLDEAAKERLVSDLSGGIVLAKSLPKMDIPKGG